MTRKEIKNTPELVDFMLDKCVLADSRIKVRKRLKEVCDLAIKALSQEPCDDAISRQNIIDTYKSCADMLSDEELKGADLVMEWVNNAPPVTQKSKTGHWITWKEAGNDIPSETRFECSVCHDAAQTLCNGLDLLSPFCPNCGAKMVEPQESEDKE